MSNALMRRGGGNGVVPAVCSALLPGVGQLVNGETDKAIGVFAVIAIAGSSLFGILPILGGASGLILGATWLYGVADAYVQGRRRR